MHIALRHIETNEMRLLAEVGPLVIAAGGWLMAQAAGLDPSLSNLIGSGVTIAVLAWYVVYDVRVRTPKLLGAFTKEQDAIRESFREEQAGSRETFKHEQAQLRQTFTVAIDTILRDNRDDRGRMREAHAAEVAEWRHMLNELMVGFRTAVHDVKNTAQDVVSQTELLIKKGQG